MPTNSLARPPVVVLGYRVWQQQFGGRADVIGQTVQLGETTTTVVGVMPDGFAFPINHRLWVPLQLRPSGYAPLEGPAVRVYGRLAPDATQAQANAELTTLAERTAADSPRTHERLRPRVLAYGGESPGDRTWLEFAITHLPILLVLIVACTNVGTLVYARTATREAEIATRYALGAGRSRIVAQLFVEALVLASVAAVIGLAAAHWAVRWGMRLYYSGQNGGPPFWVNPGLKPTTILYAAIADDRRRGDPRRAACAEGHLIARPHAAADPRCRRLHAAIWQVLDDGDDRAGRTDGHPACRRRSGSRKRRCAIEGSGRSSRPRSTWPSASSSIATTAAAVAGDAAAPATRLEDMYAELERRIAQEAERSRA